MDRREFLMAAGAALAATGTARAQTPPRPRSAQAAAIWVDAQGTPDGWDEPAPGRLVPGPRLIGAIRQRRIDIISSTVGEVGNGPDRFRAATENIAFWDRAIADSPAHLAKVESGAGLRAARAAGKLGLVYNFQETTSLEDDPQRVAVFGALGVKVVQLTYNNRNLAGDGCLERANAGLSDHGREVIAAVNAANLLLDLSHAGHRTITEAIAESKAPPAITHSGCRNLVDFPRNTFDTEMRACRQERRVRGLSDAVPATERPGPRRGPPASPRPRREDLRRGP
jgi:membrane dipeptidase